MLPFPSPQPSLSHAPTAINRPRKKTGPVRFNLLILSQLRLYHPIHTPHLSTQPFASPLLLSQPLIQISSPHARHPVFFSPARTALHNRSKPVNEVEQKRGTAMRNSPFPTPPARTTKGPKPTQTGLYLHSTQESGGVGAERN